MFKRFASDRKKQSSQKIITFHFETHPVGDKNSTIHLGNLLSIYFSSCFMFIGKCFKEHKNHMKLSIYF